MKNGLYARKDGSNFWYKDDQLHREDGPAAEWEYGYAEWYRNGRRHREDGPAIVGAGGTKAWFYKDICVGRGDHPDPALWERVTSVELNGGPLLNGCIVDCRGDKYWYKDDQLHREDGPAVEFADGLMCWYFNGELLGWGLSDFWALWNHLTPEQRGNPNLLKWMPR